MKNKLMCLFALTSFILVSGCSSMSNTCGKKSCDGKDKCSMEQKQSCSKPDCCGGEKCQVKNNEEKKS